MYITETVITAFPRRWSKNRPDPSAVHKTLRLRLRDARRGEISSAYDLALIIIDECSRVFFDRTRTDERKPNLLDMFADAIRDVTYKQTAAFDQFLIYTHLAGREYRLAAPGGPGGGQGHSDMSTQNTLLNINPEGNLLKEIKDIMDEIHIIARIKAEQQDVMEALVRHIRHVVLPKTRASGSSSSRTGAAGSWDAVLGAVSGNGLDGEHVDAAEADRQREQREQARWTLARADQLLKDMAARSGELEALLENARNTSAALKDLLTLKQQQAGVIEAREAVKQAAETLRQGQSIMLFTVVTIVFLPLSFFATLFGMNASDFTDGSHLSLMHELLFMLPISAGIIVVAFVLAFSRSPFMSSLAQLIRNAFSLVYNTAVTWLLVKSGMYMLGRQMALKAARLSDREAKITGMMKAEVLRKRNNLEKLRAMRRIAVPPRDDDDSTGMRTPRTHSPFVQTPTTSTPMMGVEMRRNPWRDGRSTPKGSVTMYDVEMGQRNASTANLVER